MIFTTDKFLKAKYKDEDQFTALTFKWMNHNYPQMRNLFAHIPNESEAGRHKREGVFTTADQHRLKLAAMGVLPGFPDFIIFRSKNDDWYDHQIYLITWLMELKMPNGVLNKNQKKLFPILRAIGLDVEVCYNASEVIECVKRHWESPQY